MNKKENCVSLQYEKDYHLKFTVPLIRQALFLVIHNPNLLYTILQKLP